jgi:hypothetical protein
MKYFGRKFVICMIGVGALLTACAGSSVPRTGEGPQPAAIERQLPVAVGDTISTGMGTARVESVYFSALGQVCRKASIIGSDGTSITECLDGEWYVVSDLLLDGRQSVK